MGLFVYTQKGSIISMVDLPTTEIIEPKNHTLSYNVYVEADDTVVAAASIAIIAVC